ncbi:hypothetical protein BDP81DRAFT_516011 [Colletotrichum phormii]|uniref:Uncharacterized protein n=1 Tax=Colletotrichum phormii TaxID=359342 RepID=A0AAI9ZTX7_9PEZI|nr:uncharacterized protein BDP81DRAFT_516011 [Colletotrichum phormii]KAK1638149.1 hypothetical protein BDP81DRAFT_516011 [Colletotrichum phormii]
MYVQDGRAWGPKFQHRPRREPKKGCDVGAASRGIANSLCPHEPRLDGLLCLGSYTAAIITTTLVNEYQGCKHSNAEHGILEEDAEPETLTSRCFTCRRCMEHMGVLRSSMQCGRWQGSRGDASTYIVDGTANPMWGPEPPTPRTPAPRPPRPPPHWTPRATSGDQEPSCLQQTITHLIRQPFSGPGAVKHFTQAIDPLPRSSADKRTWTNTAKALFSRLPAYPGNYSRPNQLVYPQVPTGQVQATTAEPQPPGLRHTQYHKRADRRVPSAPTTVVTGVHVHLSTNALVTPAANLHPSRDLLDIYDVATLDNIVCRLFCMPKAIEFHRQ